MIPTTTERVSGHTTAASDARIAKNMEMRVHYYAELKHEIEQRFKELDKEWDIERTLEANAASVTVLTIQNWEMIHTTAT